MKLRSAMAALALLTLAQGCASGAKDGKLARCNGSAKRPANPYGTVLPTIPPRAGVTSSNGGADAAPAAQAVPVQPPTNLFPEPSSAPVGAAPSSETTVPAISAAPASAPRISALPISYGSC